ncbi:endoglin [Ambystoma mexicanum]|uniref:endoglin n=1 Tax=Ambystoma mexicanum TaxID=8296 RepID=UPI0037E7E3C9
MEPALRLAVCLLACCAAQAGPLGAHRCDLKPIGKAPHMDVIYTHSDTLRGCVSRVKEGSTKEVHVLNVRQTQELNSPLTLELKQGSTSSRTPIVVLNAEGLITFATSPKDLPSSIYLSMGTFAMTPALEEVPSIREELPRDSQELLRWAQEKFGHVASFAEVLNPSAIRLTVGADDGSPSICSLQEGFSVRGVLEWDSEPREMKACQITGEGGAKEAHIIAIEDSEDGSSRQTDIKVTSSRPDCVLQEDQVLLILQSQNKRQWTIDSQYQLTVLASEEHSVTSKMAISQEGQKPLWKPEQLIQVAQVKGFDKIWYTQMPSVGHVTLRLQNCETDTPVTEVEADTMPSSVEDVSSSLEEQMSQLFNLLSPWKCTSDYLSISVAKEYIQAAGLLQVEEVTLLDHGCRAEQNDTHIFLTTRTDTCQTSLEGRNHFKNQLLVKVTAAEEPIVVPFLCVAPTAELKIYQSPDFASLSDSMEAEVKTYAEVTVSAPPSSGYVRLQECSLTPGSERSRILIVRDVAATPTVELLQPLEADSTGMRYRFSFTYRVGAGLPACTGVLMCELCLEPEHPINCSNSQLIRTSLDLSITSQKTSAQDQGLGTGSVLGITFGAFLIGALLTAALWFIYSHTRPSVRKQPVPQKPGASESSSANHSIGSTQSTPCSTSSMA